MQRGITRICCTLFLFTLSLACQAQSFRTYLASSGSDSNPCTVAAPCRLLPAALAAVAANGEIWMLDSANFNSGTVNVTKSVSIRAIPGQVGSIVAVAGSPAMNLAAGVNVRLLNVAILSNAVNPGTNGIVMTSGSLSFQDSVVSVPEDGIQVSGGSVEVRNVSFHDVDTGVHALGDSTVDITGSKFVGTTGVAFYLDGSVGGTTTVGSVSDSSFANCYMAFGLNQTAAGSVLKGMMSRTSVTHGTWGISTNGAATANVGTSSFINNGTVFGGNGVESMGDNQVRMNSSIGTVTTVSHT